MALMFINDTQIADALVVRATEHLHQLVMPGAHLLLQFVGGWDQLVLLQRRSIVVRLEVSLTVRGQTRQTRHESFAASGSGAEVTGHVRWTGVQRSSGRLLSSCTAQLHHHLEGETRRRGGHSLRTNTTQSL